MKTTFEIRQKMAEIGYEFTPKQIAWIVKRIKKIHRNLQGVDLEYFSLQEKQSICRQSAENGQEITLAELDELIELGCKIRDKDML